jgi:hypothetical protein
MNLSANTLFHFTSKKEYLMNILDNGFFPRYCLESNFIMTDADRWAIPMVCFCDIPLSNTKKHKEKYGDYCIGLSKEWAIKKGLSPILYTTHNSHLTKSLIIKRKMVLDSLKDKDISFSSEIYDRLLYTSFFIKEYEGLQNKNQKYKNSIRFYDEREWRYVPSIMEFKNDTYIPMFSEKIVSNTKKLGSYNDKLQMCALKFDISDIRYIILPTEKEVVEFSNRIFQNNFKNKIFSFEKIFDDF